MLVVMQMQIATTATKKATINTIADVQTPAEHAPAVAMATLTSLDDDAMHEQLKNSLQAIERCRHAIHKYMFNPDNTFKGRILRHRHWHRHPREDVGVVECGVNPALTLGEGQWGAEVSEGDRSSKYFVGHMQFFHNIWSFFHPRWPITLDKNFVWRAVGPWGHGARGTPSASPFICPCSATPLRLRSTLQQVKTCEKADKLIKLYAKFFQFWLLTGKLVLRLNMPYCCKVQKN